MTEKRPKRKAKRKTAPEAKTTTTEAAAPTYVGPMSLWDKPGVAENIEVRWGAPDEVALREKVAQWIGPGRLGSLLDVGCGSARIGTMLSGWRYTGIDGSAEMLRLADERVPHGDFAVHDLAEPLPFEEERFKAVLCMNVLRHLDSYENLLAEMRRVASQRVYIVDNFQAAPAHQYGQASVAGQTFADNMWSLPLFREAVARLFPGWSVTRKPLPYVTGVVIEAS